MGGSPHTRLRSGNVAFPIGFGPHECDEDDEEPAEEEDEDDMTFRPNLDRLARWNSYFRAIW
jgi:hypothetical protein